MLFIDIPSEDKDSGKFKTVRLGGEAISAIVIEDFIYRFTNQFLENHEIKEIIKKGRGITITRGVKEFIFSLLHFISFLSLFPSFSYNEKRTEKKIKAWLKKYYLEE